MRKSSIIYIYILKYILTYFNILAEALDRIKIWREEHTSPNAEEIYDIVCTLTTVMALKTSMRAVIFMGAFLNQDIISGNQVSAYCEVFKILASSHVQQRFLICAAEWFCAVKYPSLIRYFPAILKHLYDEEIVEESVFFDWELDTNRTTYTVDFSMITDEQLEELRLYSRPFLAWLKESDDDDDEEDDDDQEDSEQEDD